MSDGQIGPAAPETRSLEWRPSERDYTLGIEEEAMLLEPLTGAIAHRSEDVLPRLREHVADHVGVETHDSAFELATGVHETVSGAVGELGELRGAAAAALDACALRPAAAGTHPTAIWKEIRVSSEKRPAGVEETMRALARREPTFALHLHIGIRDPDRAIWACDRLRWHLPLLLALSANSPFWQGRDSGLASARIPLFQAFPRVGIPRQFATWDGYCAAVRPLIVSGAIEESSYLWWDIRPKPELGTIELRIMDAQTETEDTAAIIAMALSLTHLEIEVGTVTPRSIAAQEVIDENRFLAARDGVDAELIDPESSSKRSVRELVDALLQRCREHAEELECAPEIEGIERLLAEPGAQRQRSRVGKAGHFEPLLGWLADRYAPG